MTVKKFLKNTVIAISIILALTSLLFLTLWGTGATFLADLVLGEVDRSAKELGYSLDWEEMTGNPITGVYCTDVDIYHENILIATADQLELNVDLTSVLGEKRLSSLYITGLSADVDTIASHMPEGKSEGDLPIDKIVISEATLSIKGEILNVDDLRVDIFPGKYMIAGRGSRSGERIAARADIVQTGAATSLENAHIRYHDVDAHLGGTLSPNTAITFSVDKIGREAIASFYDQINTISVDATMDLRGEIVYDDALTIAANITSGSADIYGVSAGDVSIDLRYSGEKIIFDGMTARAFGGIVSCDGEVLISADEPIIAANFEAIDIDPTLMPSAENLAGDIDARLALSGKILGPAASLDAEIDIHNMKGRRITAYGVDADDLAAKVRLRKLEKILLDAKAAAFGTTFTAGGELSLLEEQKLSLTVAANGLDISQFEKYSPGIVDYPIEGAVDLKSRITGALDSPSISFDISSRSISALGSFDITDISATASLEDQAIVLTNARAKVNSSDLKIDEISPISIASDQPFYLDMKGSLSGARPAAFSSLSPAIAELDIDAGVDANFVLHWADGIATLSSDISSETIKIMDKWNLTSAAAKIFFDGERIAFSDMSAMIGGTRAAAVGYVSGMTDDKGPSYTFDISFDKLPLATILDPLGGFGDLRGDITKGSINVTGGGGRDLEVHVIVDDASSTLSHDISIPRLAGRASLIGDVITIEKIESSFASSDISLSGKIDGFKKAEGLDDLRVDLKGTIADANIGRISRIFLPESHGYDGNITASLDVKGSVADPKITGTASLSRIEAFGLFVPSLEIEKLEAGLDHISMPEIKGRVGRGEIDAQLMLTIAETPNVVVSADGRNVDIRALTFSLDRDVRREINGTVDFDFVGSGWFGSFEGAGDLFIPHLSAMGVKLSKYKAPFWVNEGFFLIENSDGEFYDGNVNLQYARDLQKSTWGGTISISSADLAPLLVDAVPSLDGTISGSADLKLRIAGDSERTSMIDSTGSFEIRDGEIRGFPAMQSLSRVTGSESIPFRNVNVPFQLDTKTLYILPGARATSHPNDRLFKYITVDGSVSLEDMSFSLSCLGSVNIRALNLLVGGLQGILSVAQGNGSASFLENFLGGAVTGLAKSEFRDVSLAIEGDPSDVGVNKIEISEPKKVDTRPEILTRTQDDSDPERRFRLSLEISTGPGASKRESIGGQINSQFLEQLIGSLFKK